MIPCQKTGADRLAFGVFLVSGAAIVLLSSPQMLLRYYFTTPFVYLYALSWLLLWPAYSLQVIQRREFRVETILIEAILILGVINVLLSDNIYRSFLAMRLFLLTGVLVAWSAMFLFSNDTRRQAFDLLCCACLAIVALAGILAYLIRGVTDLELTTLFLQHPIPLGTVVILLSAGPLHLVRRESWRAKLMGWTLLGLGVAMILLTQKRGTFLAVGGMLLIAGIWYGRRRALLLIAAVLVAVATLGYYRAIPFSRPASDLHRLELYHFGYHILRQHPWLGIGLRSYSHERYLGDYQLRQPEHVLFPQTVAQQQTFDNLLLTGLVELGTLMTLVYLALVTVIIFRYWRLAAPQLPRDEQFLSLLPLVGLAIHSMTYDSLLFPQVNWLFHAQLGLLAGYFGHQQAAAGDGCNK